MTDQFSWAELGTVALAQGITFLYGQAAELLKRWRDRKNASPDSGVALSAAPADGVDQSVLSGQLVPRPIDTAAVTANLDELTLLTERLGSYVSGIREIDNDDEELTAAVEALRGLLELAYQQRITFQGEQRDPTGSSVDVNVVAHRVSGSLTIARIGTVRGNANVRIQGQIDSVGKDGKVIGIDMDSLGG
jgi:hypothetical protein